MTSTPTEQTDNWMTMPSAELAAELQRVDELVADTPPSTYTVEKEATFSLSCSARDALMAFDRRFGPMIGTEETPPFPEGGVWRHLTIGSMEMRFNFNDGGDRWNTVRVFGLRTRIDDCDFPKEAGYPCFVRLLDALIPRTPNHLTALAMGQHPRLGGASPFCALPVDLFRRIAESNFPLPPPRYRAGVEEENALKLAAAMGQHASLGSASPLLALPEALIRRILDTSLIQPTLKHWSYAEEKALEIAIKQRQLEEAERSFKVLVDSAIADNATAEGGMYFLDYFNCHPKTMDSACSGLDERFGMPTLEDHADHCFSAERSVWMKNGLRVQFVFNYDKYHGPTYIFVHGLGRIKGLPASHRNYEAFFRLLDAITPLAQELTVGVNDECLKDDSLDEDDEAD